MLHYCLDLKENSRWERATPTPTAAHAPFVCTESGLFYAGKDFFTERSYKDSYELFFTISGEGILRQRSQELHLTPGTAVLIDCTAPQFYCTAPKSAHWHHYWAHIQGSGIAFYADLLNQPSLTCVMLPLSETVEAFSCLLDHTAQPDAYQAARLSFHMHLLLHTMVEGQLKVRIRQDVTHRRVIQEAAEFLQRHYDQPQTIESMLAQVHLSKYYFIRLFKQHMGTTPYHYLLCYRITKAKELLVTTDWSIAEIGVRVGFGSDSNFIAQFTRLAGLSPGQYRKTTPQILSGREKPSGEGLLG